MLAVPEENMISQVKHNKEVKLSLLPDHEVIQVKEKLEHMRRVSGELEVIGGLEDGEGGLGNVGIYVKCMCHIPFLGLIYVTGLC